MEHTSVKFFGFRLVEKLKEQSGDLFVGIFILVAFIALLIATKGNSAPSQIIFSTTRSFTGSGDMKTNVFRVANNWQLNWNCSPSAYGPSMYLTAKVYSAKGSEIDSNFGGPEYVNITCQDIGKSDSIQEGQGGYVYLDIKSDGKWKFNIQEPK